MPRAYRCDGVAGRGEILKFRRTTIALLPLLAIAASWISASAQHPPAAQESPWATRPPAASATGATSQVKVLHPETTTTPAQRAFAKKYVDAVDAQDNAKMRALIPNDSLKCFDQSRQAFLDAWIEKQFRYQIPANNQLTVIELPPENYRPSKMATFPMRATHLMAFESKMDDGSTITINQAVGQEAGVWYLAAPCPTAAGLERFAKIQKLRSASRERADLAYTKLKEPVKSQLLALIAKHDNASAWRLCVQSLHVDIMTAQAVVDKLAAEKKTD
jgi:hypothetical protein